MKNKFKYTYLVAFTHSGGLGIGRSIISTKKKINSLEEIHATEENIATTSNVNRVLITNFILLEKQWGFWEWFTSIAELLILLMLIVTAVIEAVCG